MGLLMNGQNELSHTVKNKFQNNVVVEEQRNFSNPHIRFRRINGRIVPIFNNKRIGQDIASSGYSVSKVGAALIGYGFAKRYLTKKYLGKNVVDHDLKFNNPKHTNKIRLNMKPLNYSPKTRIGKIAKFAAKSVGKTAKFAIKNPFKLGLGILATGTAAIFAGNDLQMRSVFGKDFFFTKDEHGRDN